MHLVQMYLNQREIVLQQGISVKWTLYVCFAHRNSGKKKPGELTAALSGHGSKRARTSCLRAAATAGEYRF